MSETTGIAWCDSTFNPWIGCTKVGPGCDNCYAKADFDDRKHRVVWGAGQERSRTKTWGDPKKWNSQHAAFFAEHGRRRRVFCASLADVFDNAVDPDWRFDLFSLIAATPHLDWLLLTKRIANARPMIAAATAAIEFGDCSIEPWTTEKPWPNVWLGATVVTQEEADRDIPKLLSTPAAVRFLSIEPMLGPISLDCWPVYGEDEKPLLHWVICGGESGPGARPMHPDWARSLRDQCAAAGVPFLFKQWGEWAPGAASEGPGDGLVAKVGKKAAGRLLDGIEHNGFPA